MKKFLTIVTMIALAIIILTTPCRPSMVRLMVNCLCFVGIIAAPAIINND